MRLNPCVKLRQASMADVPVLEHWDRQPHVMAATGDHPEATEASRAFWPDELARQSPLYRYWIAEHSGRPIGVMLIIDPHLEETHYWGNIEPHLRAIDIWIGEDCDLGHGYGETMMRRAFLMCFADPAVTGIVIDPLVSNVRAHKFYRRLGFVAEGRRTFGDDDCLVHRLTRRAWQQHSADHATIDGAR